MGVRVTGDFKLANARELTPQEQQRIAQNHFDHWFERATSFLRQYHHAIEDDDFKTAAFDLHQSSESCYKATILVFTNYNPNEHWLASLNDMVINE
ncbi:MAG: HEPN domain-containing protein [Candidatus Thiodiazotropha sp. (ex Dulcina madagascariensis)]|nr:HEPN domain-containing protein [Candidatus Thiodiazotropha sp. (ex Dulcina madagascariensis)]